MKKFKRLVSLMMVMAFLFVGVMPSFAENNKGSITIKNNPKATGTSMVGHTYSVYKVFDLTLSQSENGNKYGYLVNKDFKNYFIGLEGAPNNPTPLELSKFAQKYLNENKTDLGEVTKDLMEYIKNPESPVDETKATLTDVVIVSEDNAESVLITDLDLGYYLVLDNGRSGEETPKGAVSLASMGTTDKDLVINLKASAPTITKEIKHNENGNWGTIGDNQIGDKVEYRFISSVPDTTGYTNYKYIIHDKMEDGLTFNNDVKILINNEESKVLSTEYYKVTTNGLDHDDTFDIDVDILKAKLNSTDELYVYFSATLNEKAEIAGQHNDNKVYLEYSNDPYDEISKDKTPESVVKDYTFQLNALKTNESKEALEGAEFQITRKNGNNEDSPIAFKKTTVDGTNKYVVCTTNHKHEDIEYTIASGSNGKFEIIGLDDAVEYTLKETKAPDGYNAIDPIKFTIAVSYDENGNITEIKTLSDKDGISQVGNVDGKPVFELGTTIVNTTGTELPETGGIGTTIFTIAGSSIMIFAAVMLIRKRNAN